MNDNTGTLLSNNQQIESKSTTGILDTVQLTSFMSQVKFQLNIFAETRRQMNIYMAQDFSVFRYIRPDENRLLTDFRFPKSGRRPRTGETFSEQIYGFYQVAGECALSIRRQRSFSNSGEANHLLLSSQRRVGYTTKIFAIGIHARDRE